MMRCALGMTIAVGLAGLLVACGGDPSSITAPELAALDGLTAEHHDPGHSGGGGGSSGDGGAGLDHDAIIDVDGSPAGAGIIAIAQPAVVDRDSKSTFKVLAGVENIGAVLVDELALSSLAGSPTPTDLRGCTVDPVDAPVAVVQRLIDRLDDAPQPRNRLVVNIARMKLAGSITHNWVDDVDGIHYRTWMQNMSVTEVSPDVFAFSGGIIKSWDTAAASLVCPNSGTIIVTITR